MDRSDEDRAITEVVDRLTKQFPEVPADRVVEVVADSRSEFEPQPIRDFVPLFVERTAKGRLRQLVNAH
ncbi:three-helix bundle dimerization domain-containing protein [Kribbella deserti]|uniref:Three-helix bundle dimerization domain-containing protein n=1 Tax=Kribbella deserti TaxID=1926257 RepID=A0ABV6QLR7_9ACTN